jgi:hypothetical protein
VWSLRNLVWLGSWVMCESTLSLMVDADYGYYFIYCRTQYTSVATGL